MFLLLSNTVENSFIYHDLFDERQLIFKISKWISLKI